MTTELLANNYTTTLSGNGGSITAGATSFNIVGTLPAALQAAGQFRVIVDQEIMFVPGGQTGPTLTGVTRGVETALNGGPAAAHNDGAIVAHVLTAGATSLLQSPSVSLESLGAAGDGITDDTAAFQAAAKLGAVRITAKNKNYKVTAAINLYTDASHNAQGSYWDMWGATITTTATAAPIFQDIAANDGVTFRKGITFAGGTYIGSGLQAWTGGTQVHLTAIEIQQWTDVLVYGGDFSLFTASAATFRLCGRVKVTETTVHDITATNGHNAWNFSDSTLGTVVQGALLEGQFTYSNNFAYPGSQGIATSVVAAITQNGNYASFDWEVSNSVMIGAFFSGLFNEVNSYSTGAGESIVSRVVISDNIIINTSTSATACCIYLEDDGANPFNDPLKLDQHLISGNLLVSASNSTANAGGAPIQMTCSRSRATGNVIIATGTNGRCILVKPAAGTTVMSDLILDGNLMQQTNAAATSTMVDMNAIQNWSLTGGRIRAVGPGGVTSAGAHMVNVAATATQGFIGGGIVLDGALNNAINLVTMTDITIDGFKIRNPNANNAAAGNNSNGITMVNAPAGGFNAIQNGTIIDDRGGHLMQFALCLAATPSTKPHLKNVIWQGSATQPFNGGSVPNYAEIFACSGDSVVGFSATANTAGASVFTTTVQPYDQELIISTLGGMTAFTYSRNTIALPQVVGSHVLIRRGETVSMTWATTAPTYVLIPLP